MTTGSAINHLQPIEFLVAVKRLPNVEFSVQQTRIPSVTAAEKVQHTPFSFANHPGDRMIFTELDLTFIVDEKLSNYTEIFNWMYEMTFPTNHKEFKTIKESEDGLFSDITILIKNSSKNPNIRVTFQDCFPTSLSDVSLDTTATSMVYPMVTATFKYDLFKIEVV